VTIAERLLAGEHIGCASWADACKKMSVSPKALYIARMALKARGREPELATTKLVDVSNGLVEAPKWPAVEQFDREPWQPSDFRNPEALPYEPPATPMVRKLTQAECPSGTLMMWLSDVHVPIQNKEALSLAMECAEHMGVRRVIAAGDILDFNCLSHHKKQARRMVEHSTLLEEIEPGRDFLNWLATKETDYILGNHEGRLQSFIDENPIFHGSLLTNFAKVVDLPSRINVVPQGGEVRLGNFSARHGDAEFKNGGGGKYPAQRLLDMMPDQSTMEGHVHRISSARRTTTDEDGIKRTRCAYTMGHMSIEHEHYDYMSTSPNWQTGFGFIRVYWLDGRPRWTVTQVEVLFDRRNRPYFEFEGRVYGAMQVAV
jgi:hypothetical protein